MLQPAHLKALRSGGGTGRERQAWAPGENIFILISNMYFDRMEAYCVKCKQKREMKDAKQVTMKNGKKAMTGLCTYCGTKMFRIGG
jgi:hypothetical protein